MRASDLARPAPGDRQNAGVLHALSPATGRSTAQVSVGQTSRFATPAIHGNLCSSLRWPAWYSPAAP